MRPRHQDCSPLRPRMHIPPPFPKIVVNGSYRRKVRFPAIDLFNFAELRSVPSAARLHAPELKTVRIDRALNVFARKPVRRVFVRPNNADRMPGTKLAWELASRHVRSESSQLHLR